MQSVGPFILGKTLGSGSTGKVKLGTHKDTGMTVAIKIVPKELLTSKPSMRRKMEREIAVLKLIDHPHVMKLYDVYETSRYLFLVLEHVEGGELFDYLVQKGRLPPREALRFFQQIISGVDYCHKHLICHRDLKPENLLLDKDQNIKLADFGMASLMKDGSLLTTSCGSPHYASPEVVMGIQYSGNPTDVWSCGVILFALLTGKLPFDDENIRRLLGKVKLGVFEMPAWFPAPIKDLIGRMLVVDPSKRLTLDEVMAHPWFTSAPSAALPSFPIDHASMMVEPFTDPSAIDPEIITSLKSLGWGEPDVIQVALMSPERNLEKVFYRLLARPRTYLPVQSGVRPDDPTKGAFPASAPTTASPASAMTISTSNDGTAPMILTSTSPTAAVSIPPRPSGDDLSDEDKTGRGRRRNDGDSSSEEDPAGAAIPIAREQPEANDPYGRHRRDSAQPTPMQVTPTSDARYATSQSVPSRFHAPMDMMHGGASPGAGVPVPMITETTTTSMAYGSPRFHRVHHPVVPDVGSPPVISSSPKRSWFASLFGGSDSKPPPAPSATFTVGSTPMDVPIMDKVANVLRTAGAKSTRSGDNVFLAKYELPATPFSTKFKVVVSYQSENVYSVAVTYQTGEMSAFNGLCENITAALRI